MEPSDLALLATLDALLQEGSVTLAARRMGLSTPAMSHALSRIRERLSDPILVRAGRVMVLTPRAESLKPKVRSLVAQAAQALEADKPFVARELNRSFVVHATDHVLTVLGVELDSIVHRGAPSVALRFIPNTVDDAGSLREGNADLAIGIYDSLPPEFRTRTLMTDRFVCVVRRGHPKIKKRISLEQFIEVEHIQVAPRGRPGGYIDDELKQRGLSRKVVRAVPFFLSALRIAASTDYLLTISERIALILAPSLGLSIFEPPLPLEPYSLQLAWHPRFDGDAGHRWLREALLCAAQRAAGDAPKKRAILQKTK
jgi:DNA-binding transcriptional LysR family regulator